MFPAPGSRRRRLAPLLVVLFLAACQVQERQVRAEPALIAPPPGALYHGVYPGGTAGTEHDITPERLAGYEETVAREASWVTFSSEWARSREFPAETVRWILEAGAVPYVRLMLRSTSETNVAEDVYTLERIAAGAFDDDLRRWGAAARATGASMIVEWGTEANGRWFPWNGAWNGGAGDGPRAFRRAYRHIVRTIDAPNVVWVFHVNAHDDPAVPWNALERYYPGDDVVDWLGVSVYGAQEPEGRARPFAASMDAVVPRLRELAPGTPIVVAEFGTALGEDPERQAAWAGEALDALLSGRWPAVRGFGWWNEAWPLDGGGRTTMRVQDNPLLAEAFRSRLATTEALVPPQWSGQRPERLQP